VSYKSSYVGGSVWNRFLNLAGTRRGYYGYASGSSADFTILNEESGSFTIGTGSAPTALSFASTGAATFAGAVAISNTVAVAVAAASTHKVTMVIGGVTYYLLASNV
jgi:hypothetical protein